MGGHGLDKRCESHWEPTLAMGALRTVPLILLLLLDNVSRQTIVVFIFTTIIIMLIIIIIWVDTGI